MTELLVIRHGETDWNRLLRFQGQIDVPLNELGELQAERLAERLAGERIDVIVASDLQRARTTAERTARRHAMVVRIEPGWREQAFGVFEGREVPAIKRDLPDAWARYVRHDADHALPGGGESNRQFHARVMVALERLVAEHDGRRIAVFTHGGVLDMLWRSVQGLPLDGPRACAIPNAGLNRLRWRDGVLDIVHWADDKHLAGLPEQPTTVPASLREA